MSVFERVVAERLGRYEFPSTVHGDRLSIKLTAREATAIVLHALATSDEVREALVAAVLDDVEREWRGYRAFVDAVLAAIRPEAT